MLLRLNHQPCPPLRSAQLKTIPCATPRRLTHLAQTSRIVVCYYGSIKKPLNFIALNHIQILIPSPGPTTVEMLLDLLTRYPDGASVGELSHQLNRPVSMLLIVLKLLISEGKVRSRLSESGMARVYFLR